MDSVFTQSYYHPLYHHRDLQLMEGWVLAALSSQLPTSGTSWVADLHTQTVLLVRGDDGVVQDRSLNFIGQLQSVSHGNNQIAIHRHTGVGNVNAVLTLRENFVVANAYVRGVGHVNHPVTGFRGVMAERIAFNYMISM